MRAERTITSTGFVSVPPLFARQTRTLDPVALARQAWQGYLGKQPEPWGMLPGGKPTLRFHFDSRALPWPSLQHHKVDGFDNNSRNVGAHALLHAMLSAEKEGDPAEEGQIGYLLSITDPESALPYSPDVLPRQCALGHGELAKNLMLLYEHTGNREWRDWAAKMLVTLRRYAVVRDRPGVGAVAAYCQGHTGGQGGFVVGEPPSTDASDPTLKGWQHLYVGWNLWAFSKWHELTGDGGALAFALALANRLCNGEDADGNDGSFRPDGSFGGKDQASSGSWHMHGHTHCLPGLLHLGRQLLAVGERHTGLRLITQAARTFDWLYDPSRNPDAGSLTGWLGEWLMVATGWPRQADCEGCTMGDVVQTAVGLGAASRADPDLAGLVHYYDRAEQIFTGQLVEQMFRLTPRYLAAVRECLQRRVERELPDASAAARADDVERRYRQAVQTAERMVGQQLGLCGFPDWANELPSNLDQELPGIHMQGCCADATIRAAHAIWSETVTGDAAETRVNLAFNRDSPLVTVVSCLPHRGEVAVRVKTATRVLVRVPAWAPRADVRAFVERCVVPVAWDGQYVVFDQVRAGQQLTVTYPLRIAEVREPLKGVQYTERWRGNTIVDIAPPGKWVPMFQRPELDTADVP